MEKEKLNIEIPIKTGRILADNKKCITRARYVIKKLNGMFHVRIRVNNRVGFLWWKKTECKIYCCNINGGCLIVSPFKQTALKGFETNLEAIIQIIKFKAWKIQNKNT